MDNVRHEPSFCVVSRSVASVFGSMDVFDVNWEGERRYPTLVYEKRKHGQQHIEYPK